MWVRGVSVLFLHLQRAQNFQGRLRRSGVGMDDAVFQVGGRLLRDVVEGCENLLYFLAQMELDPEFDMAIGGPPPPRTPGPDLAPEETLQLLRPELCKTLGMADGDDEGWQAITEGAVEDMQARLRQLNIRPARDHWVRKQ